SAPAELRYVTPEKSSRTWRAPSRSTSCSASSRGTDQWLSRRPERRRRTTPPAFSLTISTGLSDDLFGRAHEGRRKRDVERARRVQIDDETRPGEVFQRNLLRVLAAHDARREECGVAAAVLVVARDDDHRTADGLRLLKGEDRQVRAARGFADAAECGRGQ